MAEQKKDKKRTKAEIIEHYSTRVPLQKAGESDLAYYRRLAKMADQRLVRLEELAGKEGFEGVLSFSYKSAIRDIRMLSGNRNATRFNTVIPKTKGGEPNQALLHAKISAIKRFVEAPTSMKKTINQIYKERTEKINEKFGTSFTWQELGRFWESAGYAKMTGTRKNGQQAYGSDVILKAISQMRRQVDPKEIKDSLSTNIRVPEDKVVGEVVDAIKAENLTLRDFGIY